MKVAVVGSRDFDNRVMLQRILSRYKIDTIVSGGAKGADLLAKYYAFVSGMGYIEHLPDYKAYPGKVAPIVRNKLIVDDSDMVIAFWDMQSRGTKNTIEYAMKKGKEIVIVNTNTGRDYHCKGIVKSPVFEEVNGITTITEYMYNGNYQALSDILAEEKEGKPVRVRIARPMKIKSNQIEK